MNEIFKITEHIWKACVLRSNKCLQFVFLILTFKEHLPNIFQFVDLHKKASQLLFLFDLQHSPQIYILVDTVVLSYFMISPYNILWFLCVSLFYFVWLYFICLFRRP
jgi:hypothetical protein